MCPMPSSPGEKGSPGGQFFKDHLSKLKNGPLHHAGSQPKVAGGWHG